MDYSTNSANVDVTMKRSKRITTKQMVLIGMLSALSYILMLLKLPFAYLGFLEVEFSDIPAMVAGLMYGPLTAVAIELLKNVLKVITTSHTVGIGEFANAVISCSFMLPACYLFKKMIGTKKVIIPAVAGTLGMTLTGGLMNYFVLLPAYGKFVGGIDGVIQMGAYKIPIIKDAATLVIIGITPFNLLKGALIFLIGYMIFKKVKNIV